MIQCGGIESFSSFFVMRLTEDSQLLPFNKELSSNAIYKLWTQSLFTFWLGSFASYFDWFIPLKSGSGSQNNDTNIVQN
jgi:hypothetical protein